MIQQGLIPDLTHTSCIDENQGGPAVVDNGYHFICELDSQMTGPGKFFYFIRKNGFHFNLFSHVGANDHAAAPLLHLWRRVTDEGVEGSQQHFFRFIKVPDSCGYSPERES